MKFYFSGSFKNASFEFLQNAGVKNKANILPADLESCNLPFSNMLLMYEHNKAADRVQKYIDICKQAQPDHIVQIVTNDEEKNISIYKEMSSHFSVMPAIMYGASDDHIRAVFAIENEKRYICLHGLSKHAKNKKELISWLDHIFSFKEARKIFFHANGISAVDILSRYPFYSIDTAAGLSVIRYPSKDPMTEMKRKNPEDAYTKGISDVLKTEAYITSLWKAKGIYHE